MLKCVHDHIFTFHSHIIIHVNVIYVDSSSHILSWTWIIHTVELSLSIRLVVFLELDIYISQRDYEIYQWSHWLYIQPLSCRCSDVQRCNVIVQFKDCIMTHVVLYWIRSMSWCVRHCHLFLTFSQVLTSSHWASWFLFSDLLRYSRSENWGSITPNSDAHIRLPHGPHGP